MPKHELVYCRNLNDPTIRSAVTSSSFPHIPRTNRNLIKTKITSRSVHSASIYHADVFTPRSILLRKHTLQYLGSKLVRRSTIKPVYPSPISYCNSHENLIVIISCVKFSIHNPSVFTFSFWAQSSMTSAKLKYSGT